MSLNLTQVLGSLLSDGDLIIITDRQGPSAVSRENFPFVAHFKREGDQIHGCLPTKGLAIAFILKGSKGVKEGYQWRLPRLQDANLLAELKDVEK